MHVKRLDATQPSTSASLAVVVVFDHDGGGRIVACEVATADDGRGILLPLDETDTGPLREVFDGVVADALALARSVRTGQAAEDHWDLMLASARDALEC